MARDGKSGKGRKEQAEKWLIMVCRTKAVKIK